MGLNDTPSSERIHIGFFGMVNAGKSSLVNAFTSQELSIVSDTPGTTTDPVQKAMELLPLGPVVIIDTPGLGDDTGLGMERMERTAKALLKCDVAILVHEAGKELCDTEKSLLAQLKKAKKAFIIALNKADVFEGDKENEIKGIARDLEPYSDDIQRDAAGINGIEIKRSFCPEIIFVSALTKENVNELRELTGSLIKLLPQKERVLVRDIIKLGKMTVLVIPIDESAPKGRLILPQQMVMRDILDCHGSFITCQPAELRGIIEAFETDGDGIISGDSKTCCDNQTSCDGKIGLVITDSQVFKEVDKTVPQNIPLTSFSIIMARYRGELSYMIAGANELASLDDGDKVLISEACSHHRQCNDIGSVKLPNMIRKYTGKSPEFCFSSGGDFPTDLSGIKLVVHCGGCMINDAQMKARMDIARNLGVPVVNYGTAIACMNGILERALKALDA